MCLLQAPLRLTCFVSSLMLGIKVQPWNLASKQTPAGDQRWYPSQACGLDVWMLLPLEFVFMCTSSLLPGHFLGTTDCALNWHFSLHLPNSCTENLLLLSRNILLGVQFQQTANNNHMPEITNILLNIAFKHPYILNFKSCSHKWNNSFFLIIEWLEHYDCSFYKFDKILKFVCESNSF